MTDNFKAVLVVAVASVCTVPLVCYLTGNPDSKLQFEVEVKDLQDKITQIKTQLHETRTKLDATEEELSRLRKTHTKKVAHNTELTQKLKFKEATLMALEQEMVTLSQKSQNAENEYTTLGTQLEALTQSTSETKYETAQLHQTINTLQLKCNQLSYENELLKGEVSNHSSNSQNLLKILEKELASSQTSCKKAESTIKSLEAEKQQLIKSSQEQLKTFHNDLDSSNLTIHNLQATVETLRSTESHLTDTLEQLKLNSENDQKENASQTLELKTEIEQLTSQLKASESLYTRLQKDHTELQSKYDIDHKRLTEMSIDIVTFVNGSSEDIEKLRKKKLKLSVVNVKNDSH